MESWWGRLSDSLERAPLPKVRERSLVTHHDLCGMGLINFEHFMVETTQIVPLGRPVAPFTRQLAIPKGAREGISVESFV